MNYDKKIDENLYNEKSLYLLNIRELRDLGRKIGVPAPATLKKQDLVDYILKIVYGEVDVPKRNSYGRPNVREVNIEKCMEKIRKKSDVYDEVLNASFIDVSEIFKVASPDNSPKTAGVEQRIFVQDGGRCFLRKYGFVESEGDREISKDLKQKFGLENFDVVEVILTEKLFKIISINGKMVHTEKLSENENLGKQRVFHFSTKEEIKKEIKKLLEKNKNLKTIVFSKEDYSKQCGEFVQVLPNDDPSKNYKAFMAFVNLCEKFVYEGENIMVVTDELDFVEETLNKLDGEVSKRTKKHLQTKVDELLSLGNALVIYKLNKYSIYQ